MTTGMLLGKFLPPHLGHVYLGEFAGRFVDRLTIVVCSLAREPIAGALAIGCAFGGKRRVQSSRLSML